MGFGVWLSTGRADAPATQSISARRALAIGDRLALDHWQIQPAAS
ncbi:hypothetical protein [Thermoleptolyngbya sp. PKUAC-SCTB121]|nr:hypothetical protein [Thermoleptolyngbya sp. PKUAC-SCTB121]